MIIQVKLNCGMGGVIFFTPASLFCMQYSAWVFGKGVLPYFHYGIAFLIMKKFKHAALNTQYSGAGGVAEGNSFFISLFPPFLGIAMREKTG